MENDKKVKGDDIHENGFHCLLFHTRVSQKFWSTDKFCESWRKFLSSISFGRME